jgi:hypothetical protein
VALYNKKVSKYLRIISVVVLFFLGGVLIFAPVVYQSCVATFQKNIFWYFGDDNLFVFGWVFITIAVLLLLSSYVSRRVKIVLFIIGIWVLGSAVLSLFTFRDYGRPNDKKLTAVYSFKMQLELYYDQHSKYPNILEDIVSGYDKSYIQASYEYAISTDGQKYILKTSFVPPTCHAQFDTNKYVSGDLDGTIFGLDCNDPAFCVSNLTQDEINKLPNNN